ncbi:hypothetical protein ACFXAP_003513 [Vibrio cholerae]
MSKNEKSSGNDRPVCFVVMPIADVHDYEAGHFGRVYEHLLKPAIIKAGYNPVRADDTVKTDYIVIDIIQKIIESEMVVCDFSSRNPNVMYELGIRHAFNKPVVLVKDRKTEKIFDIQGLRYVEYDHSLRIDSVQKDISKISEFISDTARSDGNGINSVVQLAGIMAADIPERQQVSGDTKVLLSAISSLEKRIDLTEKLSQRMHKYFHIDGGQVVFADGSVADIGSTIFDGAGNEEGTLVDIHPLEEKIFIKANEDSNPISFYAGSIKAHGLSCFPF